jgi:hypothetical protein
MITEIDLIMDMQGRPILVLPKHIKEGQTTLTVKDESFEISVNGKQEAKLENVEAGILMALGLQKKVGISVQEENSNVTPDVIEYVADVELKFNNIN